MLSSQGNSALTCSVTMKMRVSINKEITVLVHKRKRVYVPLPVPLHNPPRYVGYTFTEGDGGKAINAGKLCTNARLQPTVGGCQRPDVNPHLVSVTLNLLMPRNATHTKKLATSPNSRVVSTLASQERSRVRFLVGLEQTCPLFTQQ